MEFSTVCGEREALQAIAVAPAVSTEDRLTALSEEMLRITKKFEDRRAENGALKSQEPTPRAASEDATAMFRDCMAQQTAIKSETSLRRRNCPKRFEPL